jgi:outer membrane protein OmpA-like peptidoglycan-associated protein
MNINTSRDEVSAFIASDNRTLYFASDRPGGFGGYDIYKATLEPNGRCSTPQNLGPVYNKETDEYGFIIDAVQETGFLVSDGDIFEIGLEEEAKPEESIVINGQVVDPKGRPLEAVIYLIHSSSRDTLSVSASNSLSGEYSFAFLREEGLYDQVAIAKNGEKGNAAFRVEPGSESVLNFTITLGKAQPAPPPVVAATPPASPKKASPPPPASPPPAEDKSARLDTLETDVLSSSPKARGSGQESNTFIINNVQFDADRATLTSSSFPALDKLANLLRSKPGLKFEIGGHTNILPPEDYCQQLSEERAKSVYDYLIRMGIPSTQLTYKGYGKSQPIELDKDLEKQKVNQRVEIKVLD